MHQAKPWIGKSCRAARRDLWLAALCLALATGPSRCLSADDRAADKSAVDFGRDILPILSDNCFRCHGPDEKARKGKLRLDTKEGAFRVKDGQTVIVSGKSAESELFRRITTKDPD